ncbi:hypothetical protein GIS00_22480 [Nakamurella sp. YIM 132087]|uniref:Transporter n=1 Tax=Nakamurella alba TaxID=2665158 RepID=A0A7K1FRD3_9ACTN|nr:hypothetical protein [Nakamurella alba]MTD16707.1 hypothetical protein [Nakamurella alba]
MVGVFASLKWTLVTGRFRRSSTAVKAWTVVGWFVVLVVVAFVFLGMVAVRSVPDVAVTVVTTLFVLQFVGWGMAPLIAFGVDETVDPQRFALLPLTSRTLQTGLLTASLVGYLPVINALVLIAAAIAMSPTWAVLPVALVCAAAQLLLCVAFSRALSTTISQLMSGRRGRDLGMLAGFGLIVLYFAATFALNSRSGATALGQGLTDIATGLGWIPPGALAQLPAQVADGRLLRAVGGIVIVLAGAALIWWWWSSALRRLLTTRPSVTSGSAPAGDAAGDSVATTIGGTARLIAGRDRLLAWRDPMRRIPWLMVAFFAVAWPFLVIRGHGAVYGVAVAAAIAGTQAGNAYGMDGSALWMHIVAFADRVRARGEMLGHSLFVLVPGAVCVAIGLVVHAWVWSDWDLLPGAIGICVSALAGGAAMAGYLSARLPYAVRQSRNSMFTNSVEGQKGRTGAATFALLGGSIASAVPSALCVLLAHTVSPVWGWIGILVSVVVGATMLTVLSAVTAKRYLDTMPEILHIVSLGDRV